MRLPKGDPKKLEDRTDDTERQKLLTYLFKKLSPYAFAHNLRQTGLENGWIRPEVDSPFRNGGGW